MEGGEAPALVIAYLLLKENAYMRSGKEVSWMSRILALQRLELPQDLGFEVGVIGGSGASISCPSCCSCDSTGCC